MPLTEEQAHAVELRRSGKVSDHLLHRLKPSFSPDLYRPHYEDRVLVRRERRAEMEGTICAPHTDRHSETDRNKVNLQIGTVVRAAAGNTMTAKIDPRGGLRIRQHALHPVEVRRGDRVVYARVPTQEFEHDGETYTFLFEEQHILAVLEAV